MKFFSRIGRGRVPKEHLTIARHFTPTSDDGVHAGLMWQGCRVPEGRLNQCTNLFNRPFGTHLFANPFPALKRRAIFRKSLRDKVLLVVIWILVIAANTRAATTNTLSESAFQGRQLAFQLCEARPTESFTNSGILVIRKANRHMQKIPVKFEAIVTATNWMSIYRAFFTNATETLKIVHPLDQLEGHLGDFPDGGRIVVVGNKNDWIGTSAKVEHSYDGLRVVNQAFAESDFSVVDLSLQFFHWPGQRVLKKEVKRSRGCTVLESTNPTPPPGGYSRVVCWIDSETLGIVQAYAYDAKGKLLKEFDPKDFKKVQGQWQVQSIDIENVQTGSRTRLEFDLKAP